MPRLERYETQKMRYKEATFELKLKTDIVSFEKQLRLFAEGHREDNLAEAPEVSTLSQAMEENGKWAWQVVLLHRTQSQVVKEDGVAKFHVSQISRDTHPLLLQIPPTTHPALYFAQKFVEHCKQVWAWKPTGEIESPESKQTLAEKRKVEKIAASGVHAMEAGGGYAPHNKEQTEAQPPASEPPTIQAQSPAPTDAPKTTKLTADWIELAHYRVSVANYHVSVAVLVVGILAVAVAIVGLLFSLGMLANFTHAATPTLTPTLVSPTPTP